MTPALEGADIDAYNSVKNNIRTNLADSASESHETNILVTINALRQVCNLGFAYETPKRGRSSQTSPDISAQEIWTALVTSDKTACNCCVDDLLADLPDSQSFSENHQISMQNPFTCQCGRALCGSCHQTEPEKSRIQCKASNRPCDFQRLKSGSEHEEKAAKSRKPYTLSTKVKKLQRYLNSLPESDKALVFSAWSTSLDMVEVALEQCHLSFTRIDGSHTLTQREQTLQTFNADPSIRVLLLSLRCGADGLNLTAANHAILLEPQWNPMIEEQAFSRVHRIGQTKPVTTVRYVMKGTIEEQIVETQRQKKALVGSVFTTNLKEQLDIAIANPDIGEEDAVMDGMDPRAGERESRASLSEDSRLSADMHDA